MFTGFAFMPGPDSIASAQTAATLWLKYFDDSYMYYGNSVADATITFGSTTGVWTTLRVEGTVPTGATKVQAAIEFLHCQDEVEGDCYDGGGVYFDDLSLTLLPAAP